MTEQLKCPACLSGSYRTVVEFDSERRARFLKFSEIKYGGLLNDWLLKIPPVIVQCKNCAHCWYKTHPTDEQLRTMYASAKLIGPGTNITRNPDQKINNELGRIRNLLGSETRLTFLDYGSGFGRWSRAAAQLGFQVTAFEPVEMRGAENENVDFEIVHELRAILGRKYDFINLEQVLEHLTSPFDVLKQIVEFCHEQTVLRVSVPNILRCPEKQKLWEVWPYDGFRTHTMAPFEHLHGFTPHSLKSLVERAGYRVIGGSSMWIQYPIDQLRHVMGKWFPELDKSIYFFNLARS